METEDNPSGRPSRKSRRRRGMLFLAGIALASGLAGAAASQALSHGFAHRAWHGHGSMRVGGPMGFMGGPIDPAKAEEHAIRMSRHFAVEANATTDQEAKLAEIAKALVKDLLPLRDTAKAGREKGLDLLSQGTIDRQAIEALRADQVANAEAFSRRIAQALADTAEVLTPAQRKALTERVKEWRPRRGWSSESPKRG